MEVVKEIMEAVKEIRDIFSREGAFVGIFAVAGAIESALRAWGLPHLLATGFAIGFTLGSVFMTLSGVAGALLLLLHTVLTLLWHMGKRIFHRLTGIPPRLSSEAIRTIKKIEAKRQSRRYRLK